jgi:hypothetical protein
MRFPIDVLLNSACSTRSPTIHCGQAFPRGECGGSAVQAFTSPDIPKRPESMKELSSVGYSDDSGDHAVFMFDVPNNQVADFIALQARRSAFITARAPGFISSVHFGQTAANSIQNLMPMYR